MLRINHITASLGLLILLILLGTAQAQDGDHDERLAEAREALNAARYEQAAELFEQARGLTESHRELARARYWEAFSRSKMRGTRELKHALALLKADEMRSAEREIRAESEALAARIQGELAQRGEVEALREIHEQAEAEDIRTETRLAALQALLEMQNERAIPVLEKILQDTSAKNRELRRHAVMLACHRRDPRLMQSLLMMLETEEDPEFQAEIVMCLSMDPSPEIMTRLMALYRQHPDPPLAEAIIVSLSRMAGDLEPGQVEPFLTEIARDRRSDPEIRQYAIISLGRLGGAKTQVNLLKELATSDEETEILEAAVMGLAQLDTPEARDALLSMVRQPGLDEDLRAHALFALGRDGGMRVEDLVAIHKASESKEMRLQVCHLLSMNDDQGAALEAMLEMARQEEDPRIQQEMVFWLGRFDDERAAEFLLEILEQE